jgi:hypothetical protein
VHGLSSAATKRRHSRVHNTADRLIICVGLVSPGQSCDSEESVQVKVFIIDRGTKSALTVLSLIPHGDRAQIDNVLCAAMPPTALSGTTDYPETYFINSSSLDHWRNRETYIWLDYARKLARCQFVRDSDRRCIDEEP